MYKNLFSLVFSLSSHWAHQRLSHSQLPSPSWVLPLIFFCSFSSPNSFAHIPKSTETQKSTQPKINRNPKINPTQNQLKITRKPNPKTTPTHRKTQTNGAESAAQSAATAAVGSSIAAVGSSTAVVGWRWEAKGRLWRREGGRKWKEADLTGGWGSDGGELDRLGRRAGNEWGKERKGWRSWEREKRMTLLKREWVRNERNR